MPTAKSFILDLLSTLPGGTMPVAALVEGSALFGIAGNSLRVALSRLRTGGLVARDARGHYRLGPAARPITGRVTAWRNLEQRVGPWEGGWIAALEPAPSPRGARRRRDHALRLLGFRAVQPRLSVRPDNLEGGIDTLRTELVGLGLEARDLVFRLSGWDAASEIRARGLWQSDRLPEAHQRLRRQLEQSARALRAEPPERAMTESFLLGGRAIRQLVLDPLLPDTIVPGKERRALHATLRHYDRLGREAWAAFLARFDLPHRSAPADMQIGEATGQLSPTRTRMEETRRD